MRSPWGETCLPHLRDNARQANGSGEALREAYRKFSGVCSWRANIKDIRGPIHFRATAAFGPVIACPRATCGRRLHGATIANRGRRFGVAPLRQPPHRAPIRHDRFDHPGLEPALALLVHRMQGGQSIGHQAPCGACPADPAEAMTVQDPCSSSSFLCVCGPGFPSTIRLLSSWKRRTAALVNGPMMPSTAPHR